MPAGKRRRRQLLLPSGTRGSVPSIATEDAKRKEDKKPIILLSDSASFLSSSQKWIGEGKSPSMWGIPDADIMRDIVQLLRERIEQGLLTVFIKIKAH